MAAPFMQNDIFSDTAVQKDHPFYRATITSCRFMEILKKCYNKNADKNNIFFRNLKDLYKRDCDHLSDLYASI